MHFWKMNGAGNDFIILNNMEERIPPEEFPRIARTLCERRMSLGADGFMVVERPREGGDFRMLFFNSDGSVGEMCGNGARCICRYGFETGLAGEKQTVETTAGIVTGERLDRRNYRIRLNDPTMIHLEGAVEVNGVRYPCAYVELGHPGLPHAVVPWPGLQAADEDALREIGRAIRWDRAFPKGANVNFYELIGTDTVYERTFERGVEDFTYACGTGTGSVVSVLSLRGQVSGKDVKVHMRGGVLTVDVEREGNFISGLYLSGPTNIVAKGEIFDEDLEPFGA
ncbi:MAG: diaminopimelate epimerase [Oscillibacter sp.]|nr:diaminopimelate epimerase [Oscillibacter sp.]